MKTYSRTCCQCSTIYTTTQKPGGKPYCSTLCKLNNKSKLNTSTPVIEGEHCIDWTAGVSRRYGYIKEKGLSRRAHRVSYELHCGSIPEDHVVRHKCDNPLCVNPKHLEVGTYLDNSNDKIERNRAKYAVGSDHGGAKLNEEDVIRIRSIEADVASDILAKKYGMSTWGIEKVKNRETWRHI